MGPGGLCVTFYEAVCVGALEALSMLSYICCPIFGPCEGDRRGYFEVVFNILPGACSRTCCVPSGFIFSLVFLFRFFYFFGFLFFFRGFLEAYCRLCSFGQKVILAVMYVCM